MTPAELGEICRYLHEHQNRLDFQQTMSAITANKSDGTKEFWHKNGDVLDAIADRWTWDYSDMGESDPPQF